MAGTTPHNEALPGQIAKTVLMPGDPLRAKFIAENFLTDPVLVNNVRGVQGYTGTWKGVPVTVMASGMGIPAISIYSWELYSQYGVENIIRVGSAGALHDDLHLMDIVIAQGACTNSNYPQSFGTPGTFAPIADYKLMSAAIVAIFLTVPNLQGHNKKHKKLLIVEQENCILSGAYTQTTLLNIMLKCLRLYVSFFLK